MINRRLTPLLLAFTLLCGGVVANVQAAPPRAVVETLHATLLQAMREADTLGYGGRADLIRPIVTTSFDFETIARIVNGAAWKTANDEQKAAFLEVFRELSVATYATNFSGYGGESFVTESSEEKRGAQIVRTSLVKGDGTKIPLNYMLRESNESWLIVNVIAQGVSDLSLKRAEYSAVIDSEGFDSLIKQLRAKVSDMAR